MAHSMPPELMDALIGKAKEINPNFTFVSENFSMDPQEVEAQKKHYQICLGNLWFYETPQQAKYLKDVLYSQVQHLSLPVMACSETADSSRTAARTINPLEYSKAMTLINTFIPNTVPFINAGFELLVEPAASVYHKVSATSYSFILAKAQYYFSRNRLWFVRKYCPKKYLQLSLMFIFLRLFLASGFFAMKREKKTVTAIFKAYKDGFKITF